MSLSYPTRRGGSSLTLVVTFFLGVLIGAVLFYAAADSMGWDFSVNGARRMADAGQPAPVPAPDPAPGAAPAPTAPTEAEAPPAEPAAPTPPPVEASPAPAPATATVTLTDEDLAKHLMVDLQGAVLDEAAKATIARFKPGIVVLRGQNLPSKDEGKKLIAEIKAAAGGEGVDSWPLIAISQEGGEDNPLGLEDAPSAQSIAAVPNFDKARAKARETAIAFGAAAREWGIGVLLAPRLDVFDPKVSDPALEARSFGVAPEDAADLGSSFLIGLRESGVVSVAKHFPGFGQAVKDTDGALSIPTKEVRLLVELLLPFSQAALDGVPGILVGQARMPGLAVKEPAPLSATIIQDILRAQMKFNGIAIADDISSSPLTNSLPVGEATAAALSAGCDVVYIGALEPARMEEAVAGIKAAIGSGAIAEDALRQGQTRLESWREFLRQPPLAKAPGPKPAAQPEGTEKKVHRVERGETLEGISKEYGVSLEDLVAWNALEDKKVKYAQKLTVYVTPKPEKKEEEAPATTEEKKEAEPPKEEDKPADAPAEKPAEEAAPVAPAPGETPVEAPTPPATEEPAPEKPADAAAPVEAPKDGQPEAKAEEKPEDKPVQFHVIVKGDTLRQIAGKYGTTEAELIRLNKLANSNQILLGSKLKVPKQ